MIDFRLYLPEECGKDGYPLAWHESIKQAVRLAAGNQCERCRHPYVCGRNESGEWSPCCSDCRHEPDPQPSHLVAGFYGHAHWRILTVHHLDGNKRNCEKWNLAALCQKCHLHIQGKVKMDQMFFAELLDVSEWFKPHLKGYLAQRKAEVRE